MRMLDDALSRAVRLLLAVMVRIRRIVLRMQGGWIVFVSGQV